MTEFQLDPNELESRLEQARQRAHTNIVDQLLDEARTGTGLAPDKIAALWYAAQVDTETLYELAHDRCAANPSHLETFAPLYMTNTCDADCLMCGMRRDNDALHRDTATPATVIEQLGLLNRRGMRAVALLTGEYRRPKRPQAFAYIRDALHAALALPFHHVLINVGSLDAPEYTTLLDGLARHPDGSVVPKLTMCTFQETYSRRCYAKFMGTDPDNPRADFERRLTNFDRAHHAGMRIANPGILVGLNPDHGHDLLAMALHARHLLGKGMEVYLSVPRLRRIAGSNSRRGASDAEFIRLVSLLSLGLPSCKIVITTRENSEMQRKLVPIVTVLSTGSAAVTPYTEDGAHYPLETSQFEVIDQRPFEQVLGDYVRPGAGIVNYQPPAA